MIPYPSTLSQDKDRSMDPLNLSRPETLDLEEKNPNIKEGKF
jgi:hypothetical protein